VTRKHRLALAFVALGVAATSTACSRAAAGVNVGVAAKVGDTRISTAELTRRVERGFANRVVAQRQARPDYQRSWLNRMIAAELVRVGAERRHIPAPTEAQVDARLQQFADDAQGMDKLVQQAANEGTAAADLRWAVRGLVQRDALADSLVADISVGEDELKAAYRKALPQLDVAHVAHIAVADAKTAQTVLAQAKAGADFAKLAKQYSIDQNTKTEGGDLGEIGNGQGRLSAFEKVVFKPGVASGAILGPVKAISGYEVVKVIERRTRTFDQTRAELRRAVIGQERDKRIGTLLTDLAKELHVVVNPRFGRWDPQQGAVVASPGDDLSSPAPSQGGAPQPVPSGP
jgi:foldase protein PrsA